VTPAEVEALFTRADGSYAFARWGRPIAPVVFGVTEATLGVLKGAIEAVVALAGHRMAETDPELGANFLIFFLSDWRELSEVRDLDRLIPDLPDLVPRLEGIAANQYRVFRFDAAGGIRACIAFVRMDAELSEVPAEVLALNQAVQGILLWSDRAFNDRPMFARAEGGRTILRPEIAEVIRAAYDPVLPVTAHEPAHALRVAARIAQRPPA
jgi:hypothetical protein